MRDDLRAVVTKEGNLCPDCATEKFGEDLERMDEDEDTVVLETDDWKHEVYGPCAKCLAEIGEGE